MYKLKIIISFFLFFIGFSSVNAYLISNSVYTGEFSSSFNVTNVYAQISANPNGQFSGINKDYLLSLTSMSALNRYGTIKISDSFNPLTWDTTQTAKFGPNLSSQMGGKISNDGNYFIVFYSRTTIGKYILSTPYDISTFTGLTTKAVPSLPANVINAQFSSDGKHFYVYGYTSSNTVVIYQYNMSTPYDISTLTYIGNKNLTSLSPALTYSTSFVLSSNGEYIFVLSSTTPGVLYQYNMSTPYVISTATLGSSLIMPTGVSSFQVTDLLFNKTNYATFYIRGSSYIYYKFTNSDSIISDNEPPLTEEITLSGIVSVGGSDHTYDTGIKVTEGDLTCENILTETGYTYTPRTTFFSGSIGNEDTTGNISRITDNDWIQVSNFNTGTTVFSNDSFIYGLTGTTLLTPSTNTLKWYLTIKSLEGFNYIKIIPDKITAGYNDQPISIQSEWDNGQTYSEGLYKISNGYFRLNMGLDLTKFPTGFILGLDKKTKYGIKGFELGTYTFQFQSKWNCYDQYASCEWIVGGDGVARCDSGGGLCEVVNGDTCQRVPEVITQGNTNDPNNIGPSKVINLEEQTDDIFYCQQYEDWTDFPECLVVYFKNTINLIKKSIEGQTNPKTDKSIIGSLKKVGNTTATGEINYGQWSESGANFADNMYRKTWNKSFDKDEKLMSFSQMGFWGTVLLMIIAIFGFIIYFSTKK